MLTFSPFFIATCGCGGPYSVQFPYSRIINGFEVTPYSRPFQVRLSIQRTAGFYICGGSLISLNYVLTAAHCVTDVVSVNVIVGDHDLSVTEAAQETILASNVLVHPLYNATTITNDYALLRLSTPVIIPAVNSTIGVVCLPPDVSQTFAAEKLTTSGWGYTIGSTSSLSKILKATFLTGVATNSCPWQDASVLCASGTATNSSICSGDSGGIFVLFFCWFKSELNLIDVIIVILVHKFDWYKDDIF